MIRACKHPEASYTFPGGPVLNLAAPVAMTGQLSGNSSPATDNLNRIEPGSQTPEARRAALEG